MGSQEVFPRVSCDNPGPMHILHGFSLANSIVHIPRKLQIYLLCDNTRLSW